ncbi:YeeE/YedE family protein [Parasulfuritortus cantonensis]|uniref:YeeE/YedE family protein n=1 Tax=Parasulfuritortus cantonensis TaxID=2528202 RepID=A0A4R1BD80_9PROT|nr:YeeE/YedE thiosulfate transporter family protein [Parasulfuritortus cantonensis]TCJ15046.1 YeeE/YedE family protein [Parasulfuritortus cantonensis]
MTNLLSWLNAPWPWYVAGPLIGLMVPLMLVIGNRSFGISNNLRHLCAITQPNQIDVDFFKYDWKEHTWSLVFVIGTGLGGFLAGVVFANPDPVALSPAAVAMIHNWGFAAPAGLLVPPELFDPTLRNLTFLFAAGVLVGFGTRYAGGCTSGHAITGLSTLQLASVYAVLGIFAGGLLSAWLLVPHLLK